MVLLNVVLTVALAVSLALFFWKSFRTVFHGAFTVAVLLTLLGALGWLQWWVPITAGSIILLGLLLAFIKTDFGRVAMVVVIIAGLLASVVGGLIASNSTPAAASDSANPEDLKVRPGDFIPAEAKCEGDEFNANSMPGTAHRWSDSVSTPFIATDPAAMFTESLDENCGNPTKLMQDVEALSSIDIGDGSTIGDVNPWMAEFIAQKQTGMTDFGFVTKKEGHGDDMFVTPYFTETAELTSTVLLRLKVAGVVSENSLTNWHVAERSGLAAATMPIATLNTVQEEGREVLRLEYTRKLGGCWFAVGWNVGDKRFETLPCEQPEPPTPDQPTNPPGGVGGCEVDCDVPPVIPPNPECPPHQPYGYVDEHGKLICKDSPTNDPSQTGNNRPGGNGLAPAVTGPATDPAAGEPEPTYTAPAPTQTQAPEVVVEEPDEPGPAPTVVPSEQPVNNGEIVGPTPGPTTPPCTGTALEFGLCTP